MIIEHPQHTASSTYLYQIDFAIAASSHALQSIFLDVQGGPNELVQVIQNQRRRIQGRIHGVDEKD